MTGRLNRMGIIAAAALLAALLLVQGSVEGQETGRYRVLVPDLFALGGADRGFGEDVAEELRDMLNELQSHAPVPDDDVEDALREFKIKKEDLDCIKARQLGSQINAQVAICASYAAQGEDRQFQAVEVWDLGSGESFQIEPFTVNRQAPEQAAETIVTAFDRYVQQYRFTTFCTDYAASQQWENALRNCEQALELNPGSITTIDQKAIILFQLERFEESLAALEQVLALDPYRERALQQAGYIATQLGRNDEGRSFYRKYLETNPGDVGVRRRIAFEIFEAGDPEGAMLFIEEGLAVTEDADLLSDYGNYAFAAAAKATSEATAAAGGTAPTTPSPQVAEFFTKAIAAYMKVFEQKGAEMDVLQLRNAITTNTQLGKTAEAISLGERVLALHPDDPALWNAQALALQAAGRIDDAILAYDKVGSIDPAYPDLTTREVSMVLNASHPDAMAVIQRVVARGGDPDLVARLMLGEANVNGVSKGNWDYAIRWVEAAKGVSQAQAGELNFWLGYSLLMKGTGMYKKEAQTLADAREQLPLFQRSRDMLQAARAPQGAGDQLSKLVDAANQYIEIQETIIRRGY